ncbi:unnamed protein product [Gordionus sp. m RMFG-2023]|uniref:uncharacterized protein LOC135924640 n=1 Tax=Gordionus sp. m RMFG-2023 TaxID=3053472 RepID=UPI0030DFD9EE
MNRSSGIPSIPILRSMLAFSRSPSLIPAFSSSADIEKFVTTIPTRDIKRMISTTTRVNTSAIKLPPSRALFDIANAKGTTSAMAMANSETFGTPKEEFEGIERDHSIIKIIVGIVVLMSSFFITVALIYLVRTCKFKILSLFSHTLGYSLIDGYRPVNKKGYGHFGAGYNLPVTTIEPPITADSPPMKPKFSVTSPKTTHQKSKDTLSADSDHPAGHSSKDDLTDRVEVKGWNRVFAMKDKLAALAAESDSLVIAEENEGYNGCPTSNNLTVPIMIVLDSPNGTQKRIN